MGQKIKEEQRWNLHGYVLEGDGSSGWLNFVWWGDCEGRDGMEVFWGRTWIEHDTIIMGPWKVGDNPRDGEPQTPKELDSYMKSLPRWDKTRYYVKLADIGMSGLMDCQTGEPAPDEVAERIMPKLGFYRSKVELP